MAETILAVIFMIPLYGLFLWSYYYPEDSLLAGKRWMYTEEPEISKAAIRYTKFSSMTAMVGLPIIIISFISKFHILRLSIVVFFLMFILGALKIYTFEEDE
ncbi:hypothetical protein [Cytobacillus massiliigabonensis]|uniref:hypothetical protein n=1 Tax=Cytobacillus massiliigabonensis TaxID=1871011 RepID=UPI0015E11CFC|nr:hypothetical protein [Cytobacillus massiliigabonensis]